ncbi:hypothetical protein ACFL5P_02245 [candidate division KSB1 bacterium]
MAQEKRTLKKTRYKTKIGALILAGFLWLYVMLNGQFTDEIDCKVNPVNLKTGKTIASEIPENIKINITGKGIDILWLHLFWKSELKFNIDLSDINNFVEIDPANHLEWITIPRGFENLLSINNVTLSENIEITLDNLDSLRLPVSDGNVDISLEEGYAKVGSVRFSPDTVFVIGPRMMLNNYSAVLTERKSFKDKNKRFSEDLKIEKLDNPNVMYSISEVVMTTDVQKIGEYVIQNIPVRVIQKFTNNSIDVIPSTLTIKITGGVEYIKDLDADDFTATITYDRSWVRGGDYVVLVDIEKPDNIINFEITPANFTVKVY